MNRKKRILFCSEASWMSTGYSVYTKEVLTRLNQIDGLEVAELACYVDANNPTIKSVPWKVYPNKPLPEDPLFGPYNSNASAQFGDHSFNNVLLDFQPDVVMDIRDWWMIEFEQRSPFRDFFHWAIMPTVDAAPQDVQWINTYASADAVFAYSEFGKKTLLEQCDDINFIDIASPAASDSFFPVKDKREHKSNIGISPDTFIVGTVMRNQKRKLYPDLFKSFRRFLDVTKDNNSFLYCHTYYPDVGWDIPRLLDQYGLSGRTLFTYKCKSCQSVSVSFFQDTMQSCPQCGNFSNILVGLSNSIDEQELSNIYNTFDVYVQYANSEGFGMPQLEAAHCGVPVMSTYYSAMESVIDNIGGIALEPLSYYLECETGCNRAVPNNENFVSKLVDIHSQKDKLPEIGAEIRKRATGHYSWDKAADVWAKYLDTVQIKDSRETWLSPAKILEPAKSIPPHLQSNIEKVNFIFTNILHKPEWVGSYLWKKVLKDCTFGYRCENVDKDFYFNESHKQSLQGNKQFSFDDACNDMTAFRNQINNWEKARLNIKPRG